jgi:hypothetical protein
MGWFSSTPKKQTPPPLTPNIEAKLKGNAQIRKGELISKIKELGKQFRATPNGIPKQNIGIEILRLLIKLDGPEYNSTYGITLRERKTNGLWQEETNTNIRSIGTTAMAPEEYSLQRILEKRPANIDSLIETRLKNYMNNNNAMSGGKRRKTRRNTRKMRK